MKTRIASGELMDIGDCHGCGLSDPDFVTKGFARTDITLSDKKRIYVTVSCDNCRSVKGVSYTDASGQKLYYDNKMEGKYSEAIGGPIPSKKDLAEHCKKHGLSQRSDGYAPKQR